MFLEKWNHREVKDLQICHIAIQRRTKSSLFHLFSLCIFLFLSSLSFSLYLIRHESVFSCHPHRTVSFLVGSRSAQEYVTGMTKAQSTADKQQYRLAHLAAVRHSFSLWLLRSDITISAPLWIFPWQEKRLLFVNPHRIYSGEPWKP